ncbi:DUF2269 domain-containing protein [Pseudomonas gingeri NCPPB 3146 = LMG 5327]|uniref:DUF2269 domain-containing protein n=2 Tax=Pseudomonas gingeri TaxID=117681 RepID=A0A7Y8CDW0_9PSED|nr:MULTISPECIES: DUF2269 domain-containing protein [Pseudomonas]NVZ28754.1 DUF2269 domain-containing protein [Pseudomonas gingeri]NVZ66924.1 DUF2269 domain-containing protein [Pseudomonas gingeri]NVZ79053.1 DUF2269 domain-containing protein [Pseudomonas gingeri]NWA07442.1 DUF2269 domain-containing protein [Pseudomonas gingeri]NWC14487.1 DUF2269 domain-containing protein [Pseudomonas gingeri]
METFTALKVLHSVVTVLLLGSALAVAIWFWRGRRRGDATIPGRLLKMPWALAWWLMALCLVVQPVSGWWLVHLGGFPLGQTWLLGSSVLYTVGCLAWAWLVVRLNRLRRGDVSGNAKFTLALAIFGALCFVAIAALMGAKPV